MMAGHCILAEMLIYVRFLWVRLQIQLFCEMQTEYQVLSWLGRLPSTLIEMYDQLYERIERSASSFEAQKALAWLMCAREPLRPEQWASAVSWAVGRKRAPGDICPIRLDVETLLGMCQNLVMYDDMQDNITYAHISVREYLETKPQFSEIRLETMAVESCLRFIISTKLPRPSELEYGFYKYSARYWIDHVKRCDKYVPLELDEFLGTWHEPTTAYREWKGAVELIGQRCRDYGYADEIGTLTNALLLAAYYGIRHTAVWNPGSFDPNATDERGLSLLALASQNGQQEIVQLLLRNAATINPPPVSIDTKTAVSSYKPRRSYLSFFDVDKSHPLFLAIRKGHPEVVTQLLDAGAFFQGVTTLEVAARYAPPNVLLQIFQRDSSSVITGNTLVQAATNKSYPETLKVCLQRCPNSHITGGVIEAIIDDRRDAEEIITQFLANRITASVLLDIWRMRRMSILQTLMTWISNLPVTEDVVQALAKDSLPGDHVVVEILRAQLPDASITAETLKAVFRLEEGAVKILRILLERKTGRAPIREPKLSKKSTRSESLELLFERSVHVPISEDVLLAALKNESEGLDLVKLLYSRDSTAPITEAIVKAAVRNESDGLSILKYLFSTSPSISTTEEVVAAAVENKAHGLGIIEFFISIGRNVPITESVVKSAAGNSQCGSKIVELLRVKDPTFRVSGAILAAAVKSGNEAVKTLEVLLAQGTSAPITERVLKAAAKNSSTGLEIIQLLFARDNNLAVTESLVSAAAQNSIQGFKLIQFLLKKTDVLSISEDVVRSISQNKQCGKAIMSLLLEESARIGIGVSALRAAAVIGHEIWFTELLSKADRSVIQCGYSEIFLAAIENGHPNMLNTCIDYCGLWVGTDKHGWSATLMATYKRNDELLSRIQDKSVRTIARPLLPAAWEISDSSEFWSDGTGLHISGTCSWCG